MYGGFKGFFFNRVVVDYGLRVWFRIAWFPVAFHFIGSCLGQREYDNNSYDYFYFSDWVVKLDKEANSTNEYIFEITGN